MKLQVKIYELLVSKILRKLRNNNPKIRKLQEQWLLVGKIKEEM